MLEVEGFNFNIQTNRSIRYEYFTVTLKRTFTGFAYGQNFSIMERDLTDVCGLYEAELWVQRETSVLLVIVFMVQCYLLNTRQYCDQYVLACLCLCVDCSDTTAHLCL